MSNVGYGERLDYLTALITYLALTHWKSRTAPNLAQGLSLDAEKVQETFDAFPGIFRRSPSQNVKGNHYYTLHARFALRAYESQDDDDPELPPVRPEILNSLLQFVTQNARAEEENVRHAADLANARESARLAKQSADRAAVLALVAAVLAFLGVILDVAFGH